MAGGPSRQSMATRWQAFTTALAPPVSSRKIVRGSRFAESSPLTSPRPVPRSRYPGGGGPAGRGGGKVHSVSSGSRRRRGARRARADGEGPTQREHWSHAGEEGRRGRLATTATGTFRRRYTRSDAGGLSPARAEAAAAPRTAPRMSQVVTLRSTDHAHRILCCSSQRSSVSRWPNRPPDAPAYYAGARRTATPAVVAYARPSAAAPGRLRRCRGPVGSDGPVGWATRSGRPHVDTRPRPPAGLGTASAPGLREVPARVRAVR